MIARLQEKILLKFSKKFVPAPTDNDPRERRSDAALSLLEKVYNGFSRQVRGKLVCDFGCGSGRQSVALIHEAGAGGVLGIDTNPKRIREAKNFSREFFGEQRAAGMVEFSDHIKDIHHGKYDAVISQNSMEHFPDPVATLAQMKSLLKPDGKLFITFGPPWFAPYGAHMKFFTNLPWVHLLFPEKVIMKVRRFYRTDGAKRFEDIESGLNKMSVSKFERIIKKSGMKMVFKNYECVKDFNVLRDFQLLRELFINQVSVILAPTHPQHALVEKDQFLGMSLTTTDPLAAFLKTFQIPRKPYPANSAPISLP